MKKTFKISLTLVFLVIANQAHPQLDTLHYLKRFEIEKEKYINRPFSYLLGQMTQIQPKTVWFIPQTNRKSKVKISTFKFSSMDYSFRENTIRLYITWQDEIPYSQIKYYYDLNNFYFTREEREFYGGKIVKNIEVVR